MDTIIFNQPKTKQCPFCAETIQSAAVKCRFCGEFLNSKKAKTLEDEPDIGAPVEEKKASDKILFQGRPSLWGMAGFAVKGLIVAALGGLLMKFPLENILDGPLKLHLTESQALVFGQCRFFAGVGLIIIVALVLLMRMARLKMTYYEVTPDRVEWSRGILDRRVDNIDMYRVIDLKMRRSVFDCIFGIGTIGLITTDKTDPKFEFEKVAQPRKLYDVVKKASLDADRKNRVVHME